MPFPTVHLTRLAALAHRLPATCWLAQALQRDAQSWADLPVWWVDGDLDLAALELCAHPNTSHPGEHSEWQAPIPAAALPATHAHPGGALLWVNGHLHLQGALTTAMAGTTPANPPLPVHALVMGDARMTSAVLQGVHLHVQGDLAVQTLLWSDGAPGGLTVLGQCTAQVGLFTRGSALHWNKPPHLEFALQDPPGLKHEHPTHAHHETADHETLGLLLPPHCLAADDAGTGSLAQLLDPAEVLRAAKAQQPLTQPTALVHALLPPLPIPGLFADESLSAANLLAAVRSPIIAHKEHTAAGWFGQTDFSLCRQHVDADGDARDNSVFITVWKQWDFYLAVDHPEHRRGLLGTALAALQGVLKRGRRHPPSPSAPPSMPSTASTKAAFAGPLTLLYRPYHQGEPGDWQALLPPDAAEAPGNAQAWQACQQAWRGVLDYVRKGTAQARARYPLWAQLQAEITPARLEALTSGPLFTEHYNDWWDGEKNGFWAGQLWIGARQPCLHEGEPWGRAFKLSWQNGEDGPGDPPDDAHAAYQLDLDEAREGPPQVLVQYTQRQSESRSPLPPCAADHLARLLRLVRQAQAHIESRSTALQASDPAAAPALPLLATPPLPDQLPDTDVFGPQGMECSGLWQSQGQDYVRTVRAHLQATQSPVDGTLPGGDAPDAGQASLPSPFHMADDAPAPPEDPRIPLADAVLQLARAVHQHADGELSARFRQRFAFAPDAFAAHAYRAGQATGPALLLDSGPNGSRVVVRTVQSGQPQWWLLQGLQAEPLPGLHGAGRSPNHQCFALCDGTHITTHAGWDGPVIARFALPQGNEGIPPALGLAAGAAGQACDELIPLNNGQRVLLRNSTGVYLLTPDAVQRLHPLQWDEDGPYTWAKNQQPCPDGHMLRLHMVHMALSADEQHIAVGDQDSAHIVIQTQASIQAEAGVLARYAPLSAYPCHATFTHTTLPHGSATLLASACHLYAGSTGMVLVHSLGTPMHPARGDLALQAIQTQWRIEASAAMAGLVVLGDANGTLHGLDDTGQPLWHHHIGGAVAAIDLAPDGSTLIATSHSGYLVLLQRVETGPDPYAIGNSDYAEVGRWIFWEDHAAPLHW
ncbi:WD40 repeat domain-containing protein [Acidovorax sp. 106]|uniref:WD40 repeat domain-containing protein n=1 Tax=Acidovorax sp. 106 TaxID=2135637 RepID=UPI000EACFC10|nr:WD40 repeat domain-containing protein [Acidovorax sp. 106]RLJ39708.1 hypothetical protein C8C98_3450 [Acidovorax sp. 106]